jgi:NAD(P)H-hydrate epimerase
MLEAVKELKKPVVVDADALNLLAKIPFRFTNSILTPHPGEAARLLDVPSAEDVQADRFAAVSALQRRFGGVCVLKGAGTLVADSNGSVGVCTAGNPGMACGGMGDLLTGTIAGLLAQGYSPNLAASIGVCLHGKAGDRSARDDGERGLLPSDLLPWLRHYANPKL